MGILWQAENEIIFLLWRLCQAKTLRLSRYAGKLSQGELPSRRLALKGLFALANVMSLTQMESKALRR